MVLNIHDLTGRQSPEHRQMRQACYKDADIVFLCYSLLDRGKSLDNIIPVWIKEELGERAPKLKTAEEEPKSEKQSKESESEEVSGSESDKPVVKIPPKRPNRG